MGTLAESVIQGAQQAQTQQGQTIGNAVQAYQVSQQLQQHQQQLDMAKQEAEMSKATWLAGQVNAIHAQTGPARQLLVDGLKKQLPGVYPEANLQIPDILGKDPELTQSMALALRNLYMGKASPQEVQAIAPILSKQTPAFIDGLKQFGENYTKQQAAAIGGQAMKAQTQQDNQSMMAVDKIVKDPMLMDYMQRSLGANRILDQLNDVRSGKMVDTKQFLGDLNAEYVKLLTNANNPALGKQERTEYKTTSSDIAGAIQQITANPTSINSPEVLKQLETGVHGMQRNYASAVDQRGNLLRRSFAHNPFAQQQMDAKIQEMKQQFGSQSLPSAQAAVPTAAAAPPEGTSQIHNGSLWKVIGQHWVKQGPATAAQSGD